MDPVVPVIISSNFLLGAQFHCLDIMQMIKKKRRGGGGRLTTTEETGNRLIGLTELNMQHIEWEEYTGLGKNS